MIYVEGFVSAVPAVNKDIYLKHVAGTGSLFREFGATRIVETWGDDVPDGKVTDFKGAVKAKDGEVVAFAWIEYPSKAARDQANEKIRNDPRMKTMAAAMPYDGRRMIYGGFTPLIDESVKGKMGYVDGCLVPVPAANKNAYRDMAAKAAAVFKDYGATRVVEAWGDDVPDGKVTDFKGAVKATAEEKVVFTWIEWPSKEARDAGWGKVMADARMRRDKNNMPFDGRRMIYGGFSPILDA